MEPTKADLAEKAEGENRFNDSFTLFMDAANDSYNEMLSKDEYKQLMSRIAELRKEHDVLYGRAMEVLRKKGRFQADVIRGRPLGNLVANPQYIEAACCEEFRQALISEPENYEIIKSSENGFAISVFHTDGDYYTKSERCPFCGAPIHMKRSMGT